MSVSEVFLKNKNLERVHFLVTNVKQHYDTAIAERKKERKKERKRKRNRND